MHDYFKPEHIRISATDWVSQHTENKKHIIKSIEKVSPHQRGLSVDTLLEQLSAKSLQVLYIERKKV